MPCRLGYERDDPAGVGSGNSRNGSGRKTVSTRNGPVTIDVPRDRNGTFEPKIVPKKARRLGQIDDMVLSLRRGHDRDRVPGHWGRRPWSQARPGLLDRRGRELEVLAVGAHRATQPLVEALGDTRVVLVNGARQAGKSTLTRLVAGAVRSATMRLLDDPAVLQATREDPTGFVEHDGLMVIDEIQLAPQFLRPIKLDVDLDPAPGRFLLTGSSRVFALRACSH